MHSDDITMGDLAYSNAQSTSAELRRLTERVEELEAFRTQVIEWSQHIADEINYIMEKHGWEGDTSGQE